MSVGAQSSRKNRTVASRLSGSLTVVETDMNGSGTYDFLLVLDSNQKPISYRFKDI